MSAPNHIVVSHTHADALMLGELETHLAGLQHEGSISLWHRGHIRPGEEWEREIEAQFDAAKLIVLLVSADYFADTVSSADIRRALARQATGRAKVIPIILRPCYWRHSPIAYLVHDGSFPITSQPNRDEAWLKVVKGICRAIDILFLTPMQRSIAHDLKYHIYISQTKVEMLYLQIPPAFFESVEAEPSLNLGISSAGVNGGSSASSLPAKLAAVCHFIKRHQEVGTYEEPKMYISGTLPLKFGVVSEYASDIAFFGNTVGTQTVSLIGASESFVGQAKRTESSHAMFYYTLKFLNQISQADSPGEKRSTFFSFREATDIALRCVPPDARQLEFMAKVLHTEPGLVVATPLYVALAE